MLSILLFVLINSAFGMQKYERQRVIRIELKTEEDFQKAFEFQTELEDLGIDIWHKASPVSQNGFLDFLLPAEMTSLLDNVTLSHRVLIPDVQDLMEKVKVTRVKREADVTSFHQNYHNLTEIQGWMQSMAVNYKNLVKVFPITESYEGRKLEGFQISTAFQKNKPAVWLQSGQHAREWMAPATLMYIAHQLLQQYGRDPDITAMIDKVDVYVMPVVNVDGYVYTFTDDRLWRKTRSRHPGDQCVGVDPNRNWDIHWGEHSYNTSCHFTYHGPATFSEKVVKGVADYLKKHSRNIIAFLDFHAYGQLWLSPWGFSTEQTVDWKHQLSATEAAVDAIKSVHGEVYRAGPIARTLYYVSGDGTDWAYAVLNVTYSLGVELRDTGMFGFLTPPEQIIPCGEETLQGVLAYIKYINSQHDHVKITLTLPPTSDGSISNGYCLCRYFVTCMCCFVLFLGI